MSSMVSDKPQEFTNWTFSRRPSPSNKSLRIFAFSRIGFVHFISLISLTSSSPKLDVDKYPKGVDSVDSFSDRARALLKSASSSLEERSKFPVAVSLELLLLSWACFFLFYSLCLGSECLFSSTSISKLNWVPKGFIFPLSSGKCNFHCELSAPSFSGAIKGKLTIKSFPFSKGGISSDRPLCTPLVQISLTPGGQWSSPEFLIV